MKNPEKIINLAIFAHVDAGKTTITENILFKSGILKGIGRVDRGTAKTDNLAVEKDRGISVRTSCASVSWKNVKINLIDTPGHVDFTSEVERALMAPDAAILMLSAVEGIQAQTYMLWKALVKKKIPVILYVNKIDRLGADVDEVFKQISDEFHIKPIEFQRVVDQETKDVGVTSLFNNNDFDPELIEKIAEYDDVILKMYLEDEIPDSQMVKEKLKILIGGCEVFPLLYGAALKGVGISGLLDFIIDFLPLALNDSKAGVSGIVFKIENDPDLGRMAYIRVFSGQIKNRSTLYNSTLNLSEKVTEIKKRQTDRFEDAGVVSAGDIAILLGLKKTVAGNIIGNADGISNYEYLNISVIRTKVYPKAEQDYSSLVEAVQILADEDPSLNFEWLKDERELHINVMGKMQIEVLQTMIDNRFGVEVEFGPPQIIYRETPNKIAIGFEEYTMPKPCWAVVKFRIEPQKQGFGYQFNSEVSFDKISQSYQQEIKKAIQPALNQGIKGWRVVDLKITLIDGEHHNIHSRAGDFGIATNMALMKGLLEAGTRLLEPCLEIKIEVVKDLVDKVTGDIIRMRGEIKETYINDNKAVIKSVVPVAGSMDYHIRLSSISSGAGKLSLNFAGYRECPEEFWKTREYKGVNPLNRSKYILSARRAI